MDQKQSNLKPTGAKISPHDPRDIQFSSLRPMAGAPKPAKFSLRDKMSPVVMQNYGSCEGFTAKDLKEYQELKERGVLTKLSGRFAYAVAKLLDLEPDQQGTTTRANLKGLAGYGISLESDFPNNPCPATHAEYIKLPTDETILQTAMEYRISGFAACQTLDEVKQSILEGNPVFITVYVYNTFDAAGADGFIPRPSADTYNRGTHEILAIGWDDSKGNGIGALEIKNHWDINWGDQGYGFIAYNYEGNYNLFVEAYAVMDEIDAGATIGAPMNLAYPLAEPIVITQPFGANPANYAQFGLAGHEGMDFRAKAGTTVMACDDGQVIFAGWKADYGNCIILQHAWGMTLYAHLTSFAVSDNDGSAVPPWVKKGTIIAHSGYTGNVIPAGPDGAHLHLGGKINGVKNPAFKDWINLAPYFGKGNQRMIVFFQVKGSQTVWSLQDGEWVGFSDMTAFSNYVAGRPNAILQLDQVEFDKVKANPDVYKV